MPQAEASADQVDAQAAKSVVIRDVTPQSSKSTMDMAVADPVSQTSPVESAAIPMVVPRAAAAPGADPVAAEKPSSHHNLLKGITVNLKAGTLGAGVEVAFPLMHNLDGRVGLNKLNYSVNKTSTSNGVTQDYSGKLNLETIEMLADYHPFTGAFRLTGGFVYNKNNIDLKATPGAGSSVNIGNTSYPVASNSYVNASVDFKKIAPYLGLGWGRTPGNTGFSFTSDIGVLLQGAPRTSVTTNIAGVSSTDLTQANNDLNGSLKNFKMYPVIAIGLGYSF